MQSDQRATKLTSWIQSNTAFLASGLTMISGDASFRRYFRFEEKGNSYIAVDAPPEYENNLAFTSIASAYLAHNINVPQVLAVDYELGFMLLQDFGDRQFASKYDAENVAVFYQAALRSLLNIQQVTSTGQGSLPPFGDALLDSEFALFNHWLIKVHLDLNLSPSEWRIVHDTQNYVREIFKGQPQVGVHRDFHSRNLMLLDDLASPTSASIGVIDFQDAVIGPLTYDAVSLLRDCYIVWPDNFVNELLHNFYSENYAQFSWQEFKLWFDVVGIQRHIKASGIFCRLCYRDNKPAYLADIPRTLQYIIDIGARYPQTAEFAKLIEKRILPAIMLQQAS